MEKNAHFYLEINAERTWNCYEDAKRKARYGRVEFKEVSSRFVALLAALLNHMLSIAPVQED